MFNKFVYYEYGNTLLYLDHYEHWLKGNVLFGNY
jgi:hypothetical protein